MTLTLLVLAALIPLALTGWVWLLDREGRQRRNADEVHNLQLAEQVAEALQFASPHRSREPFCEGFGECRGVIDGLAVRVLVSSAGSWLRVRLPSHKSWFLTPGAAFQMPGGELPHADDKPLRTDLLGDGFYARPLPVAEHAIEALSLAARRQLANWQRVWEGEALRWISTTDVDAIVSCTQASVRVFAVPADTSP